MHDASGRLIRLGDKLAIGSGTFGTVVFSIDTDEFAPDFPKSKWGYLERGIMVETEQAGLTWLTEPDEDTQVID